MAEYKVMYIIDVDAENAKKAALKVEDIMKNGDYRPFLQVSSEETGECVNIDLEQDKKDDEWSLDKMRNRR